MKKLSAIFLLSIYLLSVTEVTELFKANVLVEHFYETTMREGPVSFLDFLVMHYITDDGNSLDNDRDSQLPFKSHGSVVAGNSANYILNRPVQIVLTPAGAGKTDFQNYPDPFINSSFCNLVWNPPKMS